MLRTAVLLAVVVAPIACGESRPPEVDSGMLFVFSVGEGATPADVVPVLRSRLDSLGLETARVTAAPPDRVEVLLPFETDEKLVERVLLRWGRMEFRIVAPEELEKAERKRREADGESYGGPPEGWDWFPLRRPTQVGSLEDLVDVRRPTPAPLEDRLLSASTEPAELFTGADLDPDELEVRPSQMGPGYVVAFAVNGDRAEPFADFSEKYLKRLLAIVIDGEVESAPIIMERLPGRGQIMGGGIGGFSNVEAEDLATVLRSGALPAPLTIVERHFVDRGKRVPPAPR